MDPVREVWRRDGRYALEAFTVILIYRSQIKRDATS